MKLLSSIVRKFSVKSAGAVKLKEPPRQITPKLSKIDKFSIKVTTWEHGLDGENVRKLTGYSNNSEIIQDTMNYCIRTKDATSQCTPPVITTTSSTLNDVIIVHRFPQNDSSMVFLNKT